MTKFLLMTTVFVALAIGSSVAADIPAPPYKAPLPRPACAQFGGFYVGANAGWATHDHYWHDQDAWGPGFSALPYDVSRTKGGLAGGIQGGYTMQNGCTVFGVEADWSWSDVNHSTEYSNGGVGIARDTLTVSSRLKSFGTLRTRTGVVVDSLLLYVTGGLAWASSEHGWSITNLDGAAFVEAYSESKTRWGWTTGVGTEWAFSDSISLKSEVLYMRFADTANTFTATFINAGRQNRFENRDSAWVSRIGINYRFGGGSVYASY